MSEARLAGAGRTAIARPGGRLLERAPVELGAEAVRDALAAAAVEPANVDLVLLSISVPAEPRDTALARAVAAEVGIASEVPAWSPGLGDAGGLLALALGAELITAGRARVVVAGGAASASRLPYWVPGQRTGARESDAQAVDPLAAAAADPLTGRHPALEADGAAAREEQDAFALRSHRR